MPADRSAPSALAHPQGLGEDPLLFFTRVYLLFFQGLFRQFPLGEGCFHWTDSGDDSEITITDQSPISQDRIEQRPALVTMRGPAQFANLTLDQLKNVDFKTGKREHTDLVACTMSLNCIAKTGLEAQRVAWIVMRHIRIFKRLLQRNGKMHRVGEQVSVGPESPPGALVTEPTPSTVMVTVHSPFFFQWNEIITPTNGQVVNDIQAHITANLPSMEAISAGALRDAGAVHEAAEGDGTLEGSQGVGKHGISPGLGIVRSKVPTIRGVPINGTSVPIDGSTPQPTGSLDTTVKV